MNRETLDRWCERAILGLVLGTLIFGPLATGAVRTPDFLVLQALTLGVMILWSVRLWLVRRPTLLWPPICWAVLALVAYAVARYFTADLEYVARFEVARVLVYGFLFLAVLNNAHRQESMQIILLTLVFLALGIAFYADYQFFTRSNKVWWFTTPYAHRGTGTFISPNNLGGFLEMILPVALAWLVVSRAQPLLKILVGYAALVIASGIVVTMSRGAWISTGAALAVFFVILILHRTYRLPALVLLLALIGAGVCFAPRAAVFKERFQQLATGSHQVNDDARFALWRPAAQLWREHPWWGVGPNHFDHRFRAHRPETEQFQPDRVHNDYLNTLTDWGVAGASLAAAAGLLLFAGVIKIWRRVSGSNRDLGSRQSNKFAVVLGATLGLLAILIHAVVDFNFHIPANAIVAVTLMALLSGCRRFATEADWHVAGLPAKLALTSFLLTGVAALGWQGARAAREYRWLAQARRAAEASPDQIGALEKAFAIESHNAATADSLGEAWRRQFWYDEEEISATNALRWLKISQMLDPYNGYSFLRYGLCLDRLGRSAEATPYLDEAVRLDPNGYFTTAYVGWHFVQTRDYAAAKVWFERSWRLGWEDNRIAEAYLPIVTAKLLTAATNTSAGALEPLKNRRE